MPTRAHARFALLACLFAPLLACAQPTPSDTISQSTPESVAVLVFSATSGQRHEVIPFANEQLQTLDEKLAQRTGAQEVTIDVIDNASDFPASLADLQHYDTLVFNNNSGNILDAEQRDAFQQYIQAGGGYVGIHATIGAHRNWDWYTDLIGTRFASTPYLRDMTINVEDRVHPATAHLPAQWQVHDEPYDFTVNPRGHVHVLATYEPTSFDGSRMTDGHLDHPVTWAHHFDGGRSFYTALGHTRETFEDDAFLEKILGAILWTSELAPGDANATVWGAYDITPDPGSPLINFDPDNLNALREARTFLDVSDFPHFDHSRRITTLRIRLPDPDDRHEHALPDYYHNKWIVAQPGERALYIVSVNDDGQPYEVSPFLPDLQLHDRVSLGLDSAGRLQFNGADPDNPTTHIIRYQP